MAVLRERFSEAPCMMLCPAGCGSCCTEGAVVCCGNRRPAWARASRRGFQPWFQLRNALPCAAAEARGILQALKDRLTFWQLDRHLMKIHMRSIRQTQVGAGAAAAVRPACKCPAHPLVTMPAARPPCAPAARWPSLPHLTSFPMRLAACRRSPRASSWAC